MDRLIFHSCNDMKGDCPYWGSANCGVCQKSLITRAEIDNAPTAPLPDFKEGYKQAIRDGKTNFSKQQGEWKLISDINNDIDVVCPFCNTYRIIGYAHGYSIEEVKSQLKEVNDLPNFCEHCGADMRVTDNEC